MQKVLVTGGCGYIGSHTIVDLINNGFEPISIDNLSNADEKALDGIQKITGKQVRNYAIDLCDLEKARAVFEENPGIVGIIHFAALKSVEESVFQPLRYFHNNLESLLNVLACATEFGVPNFIFSSSCSVYGNTTELPVTESTPFQEAECPYARTKQMGEKIIEDFAKVTKDVRAISLRYFNPAGAHESALIGESPRTKANNLVPVITETAIGKRASMTVFGSDYDTRDGSCVRDYIHVMDLAAAHTACLRYLMGGKNSLPSEIFNVGIGNGVTVLEAIYAFEKVTDQKLNYIMGPRRAGDVVSIYANRDKAERLLGWKPVRDIEEIMRSAWAWQLVVGS
ncbi:MAG: UDP-glucose 4-epimerase GalE [Saprospiraceae bacterium]|nr:UDP-glucose 4-epimerase GalE [Saprospiraceae bacterium]MCF8248287.1 UDP-glucose 4-epimerase GalE [Saprospiraceae bacterium]MCF8309815.1 UDP-glucose 4-epimerase GalE [Saprospiraceae bacterium]MCF8438854.1 UDP-glucose 4-epimerase GalE [Saprospiraceae bacterium]